MSLPVIRVSLPNIFNTCIFSYKAMNFSTMSIYSEA